MPTPTPPLTITKASSVEGKSISEYCGIVIAERFIAGGNPENSKEVLRKAAIQEIQDEAKNILKADAIVGGNIDFKLVESSVRNVEIVSVSGTAVKLGQMTITTSPMIITTTHSIEGRRIVGGNTTVLAEATIDEDTFRNMVSEVYDNADGGSLAYKQELKKARDAALESIINSANRFRSNNLVGVRIDYDVNDNMLRVSASGILLNLQ